jgi:hypothetical protein
VSRRGLTIFQWTWTAVIVLLTTLPYGINWWSTPAGAHYTWILPPYPEDSFGYMAWARQATHGAWLFKIKYTALSHPSFLFHPLFLICGWLSALFSSEIGPVFVVVKAIGTILFFIVFYRYLDQLGLSLTQSFAASIILGISSGLGVTLAFFGIFIHGEMPPADLWMPELSTIWSLLWNPLFPFSLTLIVLSFFWLDRGTQQGARADLTKSGLATGGLALLHPYSVPLLFSLAVIITLVRRKGKAFDYLARYFATSLPFAIYTAAISWFNPILAKHGTIGAMKSPSVTSLAIGFGLPLALFLAGLVLMRGQILRRYWHIFLWFFLSVMLAYFPFWFQRKLVFGAQIPLCIISGIVVGSLLTKNWHSLIGKPVLILAVSVSLPLVTSTTAHVFLDGYRKVKANREEAYFVSDDVMRGLRALREESKPDEIVFATLATSRLIPAFAGNTVVWGHWAMSVDLAERKSALADSITVESYLPGEERARLFWGNGIQFIFADGELKQFIDQNPFLWGVILKNTRKIFETPSVVIYRRQ